MAEPAPSERAGSDSPSWVDQPTAVVLDLIDATRDRVTGRLVIVVRLIAYGLLAVTVATTIVALGVILLVRLVSLIPTPMWLEYLALGALFGLLGSLLWARRTA